MFIAGIGSGMKIGAFVGDGYCLLEIRIALIYIASFESLVSSYSIFSSKLHSLNNLSSLLLIIN